MDTNRVICRNEVILEGENVGQFESFECKGSSFNLGDTAELTIPLYAIGAGSNDGRASSRARNVFKSKHVKPLAQVEVNCWYEGMDKVTVFKGFIEHVGEGFPSKLYLMDNAIILRFGEIQKGWDGKATLQSILEDIAPIAQDAFKKAREAAGFTREIPKLTFSNDDTNVQAVTSSLSFRNWGARSPYDTVQKLMQLLVMYGGVNDNYNLFVGVGVKDSKRTVIELNTQNNVIGRDIVPVDGRFVDFDVKITGILKNGKQYTVTAGYGTSKDRKARSNYEKMYGESYRGFSMLDTPEALQDFADKQLQYLKGMRNKGRLELLLYPKIELMDWVKYTDTVFPELSAGYYVLGYTFKASDKGYFQHLEVTDQVFSL